MSKLIIMVGLQGSGKSEQAKVLKILEGARLIESDMIRHNWFDNRQDKETNRKLFEYIHAQVVEELKNGCSVIVDATNLSYKHRMELIKKAKKANPHTRIIAQVVMTQYEICVERDAKRNRSVGENVIRKARESFYMPQYYEGFDEINLSYTYNPDDYVFADILEKMNEFNQDNPNHTKTLGQHSYDVFTSLNSSVDMDSHTATVGILHDVGKLLTKVFNDTDGNPTDVAHFYSHENVGAYEAFFILKEMKRFQDSEIIYMCGLIQNHMRMYGAHSEKARTKLYNLVGRHMFEHLILLNRADRNSK